MPHINWSSWDINDGQTIKLPAEWEICTECSGDGHHAKGFGAFTGSDLDEWFGDGDERYEFISDYTQGRYDKPCEECEGTGKVLIAAEAEEYEGTTLAPILAAYWEEQREEQEYRRQAEAERRMGY